MNSIRKFILVAFLGTVAVNSTAQTVIASGNCGKYGNNLTWTLTSDSVLTISGSGDMANFWNSMLQFSTAPWKTYRNQIKTVIIGNNVTTIGEAAFYEYKMLTSVSIGNSVVTIEEAAFVYCYNLTSVTIPNSVRTIEEAAFASCNGLTSLTIGNSVTVIGRSAFYGCSNLTSITIPNSVQTIEDWAFIACDNLASLTIYAVAPPILGNRVFHYVPDTIPIYVPCGSLLAYQTNWTYFHNFIEFIDTTFIFGTVCPNIDYYNSNGFDIPTIAGVYYRTDTSIYGCDSVICLTLAEYPQIPITNYSASICQGKIYTDANFTNLTQAGIYYDTLQNVNGCDSIIALTLIVNPTYITQISDSICAGNSYNFSGKWLGASGIYYDTLQTMHGCDSIIELTLTVKPLPNVPVISKNGDTLISNIVIGNQWYFNFSPIENATNQTYVYTQNGIYSVVVTGENGCKTQSSNLTISDVGISEISYELQVISYEIYDILGRKAPLNPPEGGKQLPYGQNPPSFGGAGGGLPAGIYIIKLQTNQGLIIKKIIKF